MKKLLLLFLFLGSIFSAEAQLATLVSVGNVCQGVQMAFPVGFSDATNTYLAGNQFSVEISDASGSFASAVVVGTLASAASSGNIPVSVPVSIPAGSG
ncbi:MAG: hypothetical protein EOO03_17915, partial [Chitinophagaceae bacterium]